MAMQCESVAAKDEIKTQFQTREGNYKLMTSAEYSRPNRVGYTPQANNTPVKVSFVTLAPDETGDPGGDRICFNVGRELYVYNYKGVKKVSHRVNIETEKACLASTSKRVKSNPSNNVSLCGVEASILPLCDVFRMLKCIQTYHQAGINSASLRLALIFLLYLFFLACISHKHQ